MEQPLNPASLPPGTHVGPWRLGHLLGRGTFGTVYRAEGREPEARGPAALKLAHAPHDERFAREVALLSRLHHPCIPRLLGHGQWQSPSGLLHPYLAMELAEGRPLYDWAQATHPTSRQLLRLLAGLTRALEAVHSVGGVHRDVKGGNVLVRSRDGRGFLVDFGSCHYQGASPLTWQPYPPGTLAYRAPEAFAYAQQRLQSRGTLPPYAPKSADDLFALGITAWRLVTGDYPPAPTTQEAHELSPQPAHESNPRCSLGLSLLISRMLSVRPEARGTAGELAEALEQAERQESPAADVPLFLQEAPPLEIGQSTPPASDARSPHHRKKPRLTAASLSAALAGAAAFWVAHMHRWEAQPISRATDTGKEQDGGTVTLGDSVLTAPVAAPQAPSAWSGISLNLPAKPMKGQARPDGQGRCPDKTHVAINGGCWWKVGGDPRNCPAESYVYKDTCYAPVLRPEPPPTSSPADAPDGGAR